MVDDFIHATSCPVNLSPVFLFLIALQAFEHDWSNLGYLFKVVGETMQGVGERAEIDVVLRNTDLARQKASQHSFRLARIKFVRTLGTAQPVYDGITAGGHAGSQPTQVLDQIIHAHLKLVHVIPNWHPFSLVVGLSVKISQRITDLIARKEIFDDRMGWYIVPYNVDSVPVRIEKAYQVRIQDFGI